MVEIPATAHCFGAPALRPNSDATRLREGGRFQAKTKTPKVAWITSIAWIAAAGSHCVTQRCLVHPAAVVGDCDGGVFAVPVKLYPDVGCSGEDAVVHQIGNGRRKLITKRTETFRQRRGVRWCEIKLALVGSGGLV